MKYAQLLVAASLTLCLVDVFGLSDQDKKKIKDACTNRGASSPLCEKGVEKLEAGLSQNSHDYSGYLDTLGFRVPKFQGPKTQCVFWSKYDGKNIGPVAKTLSELDAQFHTSYNILPGAVMNDVGGSLSVDVGDFWQPFSAWMAINTPGPFAYWLTGGTEIGYLPPTRSGRPSVWEAYELPNLKKVYAVVILHLPGEEAKGSVSKSKCSADKTSYLKLEKINDKLEYYCCELPAYDQYPGSPSFKKVAEGVYLVLNGIIAELEALRMPKECINLKKHFAKEL